VSLDRTFGWCFTCEDLVPVEDIGRIHTERDIAERNCREAEQILKQVEGSLMSTLGFNRKQITKLKQNRDFARKKLDGVQMLYNVFQSRTSPPRCLTCGESNIVRVNIPEPPPNSVIPTGFAHPGCGGQLIVEHTRFRIAMKFTQENVYSLDGKKIKEIPID
jgi:hypothetical protein